VEVFGAGGLVVFPTETVYGVGARADLPDAVARLRRTKQRDDNQAFTVHIGRRSDVSRFVPGLKGPGRRLAEKGWPGPLTLVFSVEDPAQAPVMADLDPSAAEAMYHQGTIGLRYPDDPTAWRLLSEVGAPVVAASANRAGRRPAHDAAAALAELDGQVDLVLDAGPARHGQASTIVRVDERGYQVIREGVYDERTVRRLASVSVLLVCTGNTCRSPMASAILRKLAADSLGVEPDEVEACGVCVVSAGAFAGMGSPASAEAVEVMRRYGVDISDHRSRGLEEELIGQADHILTMTESHRRRVAELVPSAEDRCRLLAGDHEIDDPLGGSVEAYAACADDIEAALKNRLAEILA
jgi:protein-tyrosine phosphatase